jgi:hypothetical protein
MAFLEGEPRGARLCWAGQRLTGAIQATSDRRFIQFRAPPEAGPPTALPGRGEAADLHFRVRGVTFRCDAVVDRLDPRDRAPCMEPNVFEWSITAIRHGGGSFSSQVCRTRLVAPDGRMHAMEVIALPPGEVHLFGWPPPREVVAASMWEAQVLLGHQRMRGLQVEISGSQPIFPGAGGRAFRARILTGQEQIAAALAHLTQLPDERSQPF